MDTNEKLDQIITTLGLIEARLDEIEAKIASDVNPPEASGGLYGFIRPPDDAEPHGFGIPMTSVDVDEAILRACHNVRWAGDIAISPEERDFRWGIIELLKKQDPSVLPHYAHLDPAFCGFGLLTNLFGPHTDDRVPFSRNKQRREKWAGHTIASFLEGVLKVSGGPGTPEE